MTGPFGGETDDGPHVVVIDLPERKPWEPVVVVGPFGSSADAWTHVTLGMGRWTARRTFARVTRLERAER